MSGLSEIQEAIKGLPKDQRHQLRQWLDALEDDGFEESDELIAAIDEGIHSLETEGGIPLEAVRQEFLDRWGTK